MDDWKQIEIDCKERDREFVQLFRTNNLPSHETTIFIDEQIHCIKCNHIIDHAIKPGVICAKYCLEQEYVKKILKMR